ncbi:MAG: glycosyltransferase family 4 protein [Candidatus Limnocylindrales bacterium]
MKPAVRFLTHSPPAAGISGDRIRTYNLMRQLQERGWRIDLFSLVAPDEPAGHEHDLDAVVETQVRVPRNVPRWRRGARLGLDLAARRAFQGHWFWSRTSANAATAWLGDATADVLFVEQLYMYPFVPPRLRARVILDTQNHEVTRMRAIARGEGGVARRTVARLQVGPVDRFEREVARSVARLLAVSREEYDAFERLAPGRVRLVPNGVDVAAVTPLAGPPPSRSLLFLGSLGYSANADAVRHFVGDIAPYLAASQVSLTVVGSNPPPAVFEAAARAPLPTEVTGFVPSVDPYIRASRAMIVPLRHGAGTRLKILEALAWGLPVVTTTIGAAGLGLTDGKQALIADEPRAFAAAVERLAADDQLWLHISREGRAFVERHFDWRAIGDVLDATLRELQVGGR